MSVRSITLGLLVNGLLALGVQATDLSPPPSSVPDRIAGLEVLQPEMPAPELSSYIGDSKLIVIFADEPDDADFIAQIDTLRSRVDDLAARDVVLLTDTAPSEDSPLRQSLRPRGFFSLLLIDSTGMMVQRRRSVTDARRLLRQIDEMR